MHLLVNTLALTLANDNSKKGETLSEDEIIKEMLVFLGVALYLYVDPDF